MNNQSEQEKSANSIEPNALSSRYNLQRTNDELIVSWRWAANRTTFLIVFFGFWNAFMFHVVVTSEKDPSDFVGFVSGLPLNGLFLLIGILGACYVALMVINQTTVTANSEYLKIKHFPIPCKKSHEFRVSDIQELYVAIYRSKLRGSGTVDYPELQLVTKSGRTFFLFSGKECSAVTEISDYTALHHLISQALGIAVAKVQDKRSA